LPTPFSRMLDMLISAGIRTLFWLLRMLPARWAGALGAGLGRLCFALLRRHRVIAITNLKRIYPQQAPAWHADMARRAFAELGRTSLELPHVFLRSRAFLRSRVDVVNEHLMQQAMASGEGAFVAACHHCNWELGGLMLSLLGYDTTVIYRPAKYPALERYLKQCRERFGASMQSRWEGLRWLPKTLKRGSAIAIMVDQHMSQGLQVPFMGHMANTTPLPATFHIRQQTPIIGVSLKRKGSSFHFTLEFHPVDLPALSDNKERDAYHIMRQVCASFTPIINERAELWLWIHRRWYILEQDQELAEVIYAQT